MPRRDHERGATLIGALLIIVILFMLGMVSLNVAGLEIESMAAARDEAVARHLAEAGADLIVRWFHDPASPPDGPGRTLFAKRLEGPSGTPSFFDAAGQSQFAGTEANPDLLYDASRPADDRFLNDPATGWLRGLLPLGRVTQLAVYGPISPGLLCTVKVTAVAGRRTRTLVTQVGAPALPPIRAAVQLGLNGPVPAAASPLPVSVHWGDLLVNGDANLGRAAGLPVKSESASPSGQAYSEMTVPEDRWLDLLVGGNAIYTRDPGDPDPVPENVRVRQEPAPGLPLDHWDYRVLKDAALRLGTYYARGQDGLLYPDGVMEPGQGVTLAQAVRSGAMGEGRGLVFVDTLDHAPPRSDNLGTLTLDAEYMEGLLVINADVRLAPAGFGRSLPAHSPPLGSEDQGGTRVPVELSGITLRGALITPGSLILERAARVFGAVVVGGTIGEAPDTGAHLEVWYDPDFQQGLYQGVPLVHLAIRTWPEK